MKRPTVEVRLDTVLVTVDEERVLLFDTENHLKSKAKLQALRNLLYRKFDDIITVLDNLTRGA